MPPLGLYLHVPFCRSKCSYCDFYSLPHREAEMDAYVSALLTQLAAFAPRAADHCVDTVYFGGGTPTCLGAERLVRLLDGVKRYYSLSAAPEITTEANPESARDEAALRLLRRAGFNRISLGAQSFCDAELRAVGRIHTAEEIAQAVASARRAGFENLSLDLIYGLPGQTQKSWLASLASAAALRPEHLSCYGLKVEPGTPLAQSHASLPDEDAQADAYLAAVSYLAAQGYGQYEISNFCRAGFASRHNLKYWTLGEYLGFGPGAHSDYGGRRFALARDLDAYLAGNLVYSEDSAPDARERAAETVMLRLRTADGLCENALPFPLAPAVPFLEDCVRHGLARSVPGGFALTPEGFLVSNRIILGVQDALGL